MHGSFALLLPLCLPLLAGELPPDAAALKVKRDVKIAEINQLYANELEKLQKLALKNGSLEAANAIEKEIAAAAPNPLRDSNSLRSIVGKWKRSGAGTNIDGHVFQFADEKSGVFNGKKAFSVRYNASSEIISISPFPDKIKFTNDPDVLEGVNEAGLTYKLVRIY